MAEEPEILVGVAASIAAYKACDVVSALRKRGAGVTVLLTRNASQFVAPLALAALSGRPVGQDLFHEPAEWGVGHITLAKRARAFVIVGATADLIARLAAGMADDFVTTCALATRAPLLLAPAMNTAMWEHPATQANLTLLKARGARVVDPAEGRLACGDLGKGRLADPQEIARQAWELACGAAAPGGALAGVPVLVTAGPTREPLDPVRFISNPSSGKMGYALARAFAGAGAEVSLISGPVSLPVPAGVELIRVTTAQEMLEAAQAHFKACRVYVSAAAVSDFRPAQASHSKVKKNGHAQALRLLPTIDILKTLARAKGPRILVGFAAETEDLLKNAAAKLKSKRLDLLVANAVGLEGQGFAADDNEAWLLAPGLAPRHLPLQSKDSLAQAVVQAVAARLKKP
jgi:phosphopantothenoylcysteine decarboxylase/phosphopantothenate--cysteine ligase